MAKSDIPFDLFFEKYYPEGRLVEHIDLSKVTSTQEYTKALNGYFDMMERVTLDDLKSLSEEELNCVPTSWLYDWHHCKANYFADGEPEKFIDGVYKKREEYKKISSFSLISAYHLSRERNQFTAEEGLDSCISYDEFLQVTYYLITHGYVRYKDGVYTVIRRKKFYP